MDREAAHANAHTLFPGEIAAAQQWQQDCQSLVRLEKYPNLPTSDHVNVWHVAVGNYQDKHLKTLRKSVQFTEYGVKMFIPRNCLALHK